MISQMSTRGERESHEEEKRGREEKEEEKRRKRREKKGRIPTAIITDDYSF